MGGPEPDPSAAEPALPVSGWARREPYLHPNDDFVQAGNLYRFAMNDMDREHLVSNIIGHLGSAQKRLQLRQSALFYKADPDYGCRVAEGLSLDVQQVIRLAGLSQDERVKATLE
jgi:catalase